MLHQSTTVNKRPALGKIGDLLPPHAAKTHLDATIAEAPRYLWAESDLPLHKLSQLDAIPLSRRGMVIATLFDSALPIPAGGREFLRPLWAEEAVNRATHMMKLVLLLEEHSWKGAEDPAGLLMDLERARHVANLFHSLHQLSETAPFPCADILPEIAISLIDLFGPTTERVTLMANVMALSLPAYRRRALVLAVAELMIQSMMRGFHIRQGGEIKLTLESIAGDRARLVVEDNAPWAHAARPQTSFDIVGGLAGLLEADLVWRRPAWGGTLTELTFPK